MAKSLYGYRGHKDDNLTAMSGLILWKMRKPRRLKNLCVSMTCYMDSFTSHFIIYGISLRHSDWTLGTRVADKDYTTPCRFEKETQPTEDFPISLCVCVCVWGDDYRYDFP
jgi:hypothetical protein